MSQASKNAEQFVERVKRMVNRKDDVIANVETNVDDTNVISPSTIGDKDAWVEVTLYNVSDPNDLFTPREWMELGKMGADLQSSSHEDCSEARSTSGSVNVDTYTGNYHNGYNPTVEIHKRFSGGD